MLCIFTGIEYQKRREARAAGWHEEVVESSKSARRRSRLCAFELYEKGQDIDIIIA